MKKIISIPILTLAIIFLVVCIAPTVALADFTSDDIKSADGHYTYRILDNSDKIAITDYSGPGGDISIPAKIDGYFVTNIAIGAFQESAGVTSFTVPEGVTSMGYCIFINNPDLVTVTLPASLDFIDGEVFYNCPKLTAINVHSSSSKFCTSNGCLFSKDMTKLYFVPGGFEGGFEIPSGVTEINASAFEKCEKITSVSKIGSGVTKIGRMAFSECALLKAIDVDDANPNYSSQDGVLFDKDKKTLIVCPAGRTGTYDVPGTVAAITEHAFDYCGLTVIHIPANVLDMGESVFPNGAKLTAINVDGANPNFASVDGVLFNKDLTKLLAYPAGKDAVGGASSAKARLKAAKGSFTIPSSVKEIGVGAFEGCAALKKITIPKSVTVIGDDAFKNCGNLSIYGYKGSAAQTYANKNGIAFIVLDGGKFTITVKPNKASYGSVKGAGKYLMGETAALTAIPKSGCRFVKWTIGGKKVSGSYQYGLPVYKKDTVTAEFARIGKPSLNSAGLLGDKKVKISWDAVSGAAGYVVYRSSKKSTGFAKVTSVTTKSFTDTGLKAGKIYYYKIKAYCKAGTVKTYSAYSSVKATKPVR
jgi:hypothetical protein